MKNTIVIVVLSVLAVSANAENVYRKAEMPVQRVELSSKEGVRQACIGNKNTLVYQCSKWWQHVEPKKNTKPCVAGCIGSVSVS